MKWISVEERLPEVGVRVLAFTGSSIWIVKRRIPAPRQRGGPWDTPAGFYEDGFFTHWMPLPDPPEGQ